MSGYALDSFYLQGFFYKKGKTQLTQGIHSAYCMNLSVG